MTFETNTLEMEISTAFMTLETEISTAYMTLKTNVLSLSRTITFLWGSPNPQNKGFFKNKKIKKSPQPCTRTLKNHILKNLYYTKIQLAFQVTKFFILEVYVDIFILT